MYQFKRIITEEEQKHLLEPGLRALSHFVDQHGGEDLIRHLHAQDVEIVSHTTGAILKCLRTDETDTSNPSECWQFFAGKYEIDANDMDLTGDSPEEVNRAPGFTHRDYSRPIKYIFDLTKEGKLNEIEPGTLIIVQATAKEKPGVRLHKTNPKGHMTVVGVRYDSTPEQAKEILGDGRPGEIEKQAVQYANRWESHAQVQHIASVLGTDSVPLFFRGKLTTTTKAIAGMDKSAEEDPLFRKILDDFLGQAGDHPQPKDYERFFRTALRRFDDMEIRHLDQDGRVEDRTAVTRENFKDVIQRIYQRFDDASEEIATTIENSGKDSQEHQDDYRDLNYLQLWIRDQVGKIVFDDAKADPISRAMEALHSAGHEATEEVVMQWIRRDLEESGVMTSLYKEHLADPNVPSSRHAGKQTLFEMFMREVQRIIQPRLADLITDAT